MSYSISSKTWCEISEENLCHNSSSIRSFVKQSEIIAVIKSNAYGHDLKLVATCLQKQGVNFFAVDDILEAFELRNHGISGRIIVIGFVPFRYLKQAAQLDIEISVSTIDSLVEAVNSGCKIHLELETGLGRQGFLNEDFEKIVSQLPVLKRNCVVGVFSHLATAGDDNEIQFLRSQAELFKRYSEELEKRLALKLMKHLCASASSLVHSEYCFDAIRIGFALFGYYSTTDLAKHVSEKLGLRPVLRWKSVVSEIKNLPKGHSIGYDRTHTLDRDSTIAIVPIGYFHGFPRSLSNKGYVLFKDTKVPVIGRVSMDMIIVDITDYPRNITVGSEITIMNENNINDLAKYSETITYELLTRINPMITRIAV